MTLDALRRHGVMIESMENGWAIPASQAFRPNSGAIEGDWSSASWWLTVNTLQGGGIVVEGLPAESSQPDRAIGDYLRHLPESVDISRTPDLFPTLALLAAMTPQATRFIGGTFLRRKESDRLRTVAVVLSMLGARVTEEPDGLTILGGKRLEGGAMVEAFGDHRIAMLCACAALFCRCPVTLRGGDCVAKSYEDFWRDYTRLGGTVEEVEESGG